MKGFVVCTISIGKGAPVNVKVPVSQAIASVKASAACFGIIFNSDQAALRDYMRIHNAKLV